MASSNGSKRRTPPPADPLDALGETGRARTVAQMLQNIQQQRFTLDVEIVANGLTDESAVVSDPAFPGQTVAQKKALLQEVEDRLQEKFADLMPKVRQIIEMEVR